MDDYLPKPVRLTDLIGALQRSARTDRSTSSPPEPTTDVAEPVLDAEQFARLRDEVGDEVLAAMLRDFAGDAPRLLDQIDGGIAVGDAPLVRRLAHTLRGNASYLGGTEVVARCAELETAAHEGSLGGAGDLLAVIRAAHARLAATLESSVGSA
jgi:two-component system sensor histidine kinase BarA